MQTYLVLDEVLPSHISAAARFPLLLPLTAAAKGTFSLPMALSCCSQRDGTGFHFDLPSEVDIALSSVVATVGSGWLTNPSFMGGSGTTG